jgi:ferredoxin
MSTNSETLFEAFLNQHDHTAWSEVLKSLLPAIHEVDRNATQIWFAFYPLSLAQLLQQAEDPAKLEKELLIKGKYHLKDQIDSSHQFLYGHRYWPEVKKALVELASSAKAPSSLELATQVRKLASEAAAKLKAEESLLVGITAVAFMTLQQVGMTAFKMSPGRVNIGSKFAKKSPAQILKERAKDNGQGLFGFLKSVDKEWSINFNENDDSANFKLIDGQDLAMGAANDRRDYRSRDQRCIEGPIPVECRSAACGTCWVGILGGAEKLREVGPLERRKIKEFGYIDTDEPKPLIRLACKSECFGAVSIVIPPWNGFFGRQIGMHKSEKEEKKDQSLTHKK